MGAAAFDAETLAWLERAREGDAPLSQRLAHSTVRASVEPPAHKLERGAPSRTHTPLAAPEPLGFNPPPFRKQRLHFEPGEMEQLVSDARERVPVTKVAPGYAYGADGEDGPLRDGVFRHAVRTSRGGLW